CVSVAYARQRRVVSKAMQLDELVVPPLAQLEGPGTDGRAPVSIRIHRIRVQDAGASPIGSDQRGEKHRRRAIERNDHRVRIWRRDRQYTCDSMIAELSKASPAGLRIQVTLQRPDDFGRGQFLAVVK